MSIYKDPALPIQLRLDAASKALPYEKPRVAPVDYAPQVASREPVTIFHRLDQASMDKILELVK